MGLMPFACKKCLHLMRLDPDSGWNCENCCEEADRISFFALTIEQIERVCKNSCVELPVWSFSGGLR